MIETSRLAFLESELKLKNFELQRCSLLLAESEEKAGNLSSDKEILLEKLQVVREEHNKLTMESKHKTSSLERQVEELEVKLSVYAKQEEDLDTIILEGANLPDSSSAQALTLQFGSAIPTTAKRRLQYAITLARKAMEYEARYNELKRCLYAERDQRKVMEEELHEVNFALSLAAYPVCDLLELIRRRDKKLAKLTKELEEVRAREQSLRQDVAAMESYKNDIEQQLQVLIAESKARAKRKNRCKPKREHAQSEEQRIPERERSAPWYMKMPRVPPCLASMSSNLAAAIQFKSALTRTKISEPPPSP